MIFLIFTILLASPDYILVERSEWDAITFRLCGENGSVSRDENGPVCSEPDQAVRTLGS